MIKNENGISLVQVLIAAGLLGVLSLVLMQLMKNFNDSQSFAQSKSDELDLKNSIRMILNDEKFCRVSFAGEGPSGNPTNPVTFKKKNIDQDNEGLDVSLYFSNQSGDQRTIKKFNGANNPGTDDKSLFGNLKIKSMKLIMNNGSGSNYNNAPLHHDIGVLRLIIEKKISTDKKREMTMDFDINLSLSTGQSPESNKETRILSCLGSQDAKLVMESGTNIAPDTCITGLKVLFETAFFCTSGQPSKLITFSKPFSSPPTIIITLSGPAANSSMLPCTGGAMDQVGHRFSNVTKTGFTAYAWMSPSSFSTSCSPYTNYSGPIKFNWYAIGYR